ncbi:hypothetical protein [Nocardia sp. NPDC050435]|uniref:hypothetical protein n=1 Tax=Nocardia sp. NPDC050435 TaxID=3155040 RepID=UPI00340D731C
MNDVVVVNGERYQEVSRRSTSDSGAKFYGRFVFTLKKLNDGSLWTAYGKRVSHNSRLTPVS